MKSKLLAVRLWYSTSGNTEFIRKEIYKHVVRDSNTFMWHRWNYVTTRDDDLYNIVNVLSRIYDGLHAVQLPCVKRVGKLK